jgi:hypothetical protein
MGFMINRSSSDGEVVRPVLRLALPHEGGEDQQGEGAVTKLEERLAIASADIRNALVPLQTVAELLRQGPDEKTQGWCSWMLRREVRHIVRILEALTV